MDLRFSKRDGRTADTVPASRRAARLALWLTASMLGMLTLVGPSFGAVAPLAVFQSASPTPSGSGSASPSASPSGSPAGPSVAFLNPGPFDKGYTRPPRQEGVIDPPKISDRDDGVDTRYHIVAGVGSVPLNPIVEAYIRYGTQNEITIGLLDRIAGTDTWEYYWDIPNSLDEGAATMIVRLYTQTPAGIEEVANHDMAVDMQHKETIACTPPPDNECVVPPPDLPADETVELTWPTSGGQLGFFKSSTGPWRTVLDGITSSAASELELWYTTSSPGTKPKYVQCGHVPLYATSQFQTTPIPWQANCTLAGKDTPDVVVAVAAVPEEGDYPDRRDVNTADELTQDSSDAHVISSYIQDPRTMKISLLPNRMSDYAQVRRRLVTNGGCLAYMITVTDNLGRPVQGANVDVHMTGPGDQAKFGTDTTAATAGGSNKAPDAKDTHSQEAARNCDSTLADGATARPDQAPPARGSQGDHNRPGLPDNKHLESAGGTGVSGGGVASGTPPLVGMWRFHIYSINPGISDLVAWIDENPELSADGKRAADSDTFDPGEPSATDFAQWYAAAPTVDIVPVGGTAQVGSCFRYVARIRSGAAAVADINVDVHAQGPSDDLDFCDVADGTARRAPDKGPASNASPHEPQSEDEAAHVGASPRIQHTEGETDEAGDFVFGLSSPVTGDTTITVWVDGEKAFINTSTPDTDNDIQDAGEPTRTVTHTWASSAENATVRLVNPSAYGAVTKVSNKADANGTYHLVARVDTADVILGVEFLFISGATETKIGDGARVGNTDTFELEWNTSSLAAGTYTVRARIIGTTKVDDRSVALDNTHETVDIAKPANATLVPFSNRATTITGVASSGTRRVILYYTRNAARTAHESGTWTECGSVSLPGAANPQGFTGTCTLVNPDQAASVTGIAALSADCAPQLGCPSQTNPLGSETKDSGDAHRVFGYDARPLVALEPAEAQAKPGECSRYVLSLKDQSGQAIGDSPVDVHVSGPTRDIAFCEVEDASPRSAPSEGGHTSDPDDSNTASHDEGDSRTIHTEGRTRSDGKFVFGITSADDGDSQLTAWVEITENDVQDGDEASDTAVLHWTFGVEPTTDCTIQGTSDDDALTGTREADIICGFGGNDTISGADGNDILRGGSGDDLLDGGDGNDLLRGQQGDDRLHGRAGDDKLVTGAGNDSGSAGSGRDILKGGKGKDTLRGSGGADVLIGQADDDRLFGGAARDEVRGGKGDDSIDGGPGRDTCVGGAGRDNLRRCE